MLMFHKSKERKKNFYSKGYHFFTIVCDINFKSLCYVEVYAFFLFSSNPTKIEAQDVYIRKKKQFDINIMSTN